MPPASELIDAQRQRGKQSLNTHSISFARRQKTRGAACRGRGGEKKEGRERESLKKKGAASFNQAF